MIRARWPGRLSFRGGGEGDLWRLEEFAGEGERRELRCLGVELEGERDLLRFLAGSSLVALKG